MWLSKPEPLITLGTFVYFRRDIEKDNIIDLFALGAGRQEFNELDVIPINGDLL